MAPKRKKAEVAVADPPAAKVRRSSRKANSVATQQHDASRQGKDPLGPAGGSTASQEAFERTMRELGEMGLKLQSAVKRQRLAVETSDLSKCDPDKVREDTFSSRAFSSRRAKLNQEKDFETKPVEKPSVDERAEPADTPDEKDTEAVERSARRPPPVNSDILPLPWRGRLGYVSVDILTKKILEKLD